MMEHPIVVVRYALCTMSNHSLLVLLKVITYLGSMCNLLISVPIWFIKDKEADW